MTITQWAALLSNLSFPVSHYEFSKPTPAPCLVYTDSYSSVHADSSNILEDYIPTLELYCRPGQHGPVDELEDMLKANHITYTLDSEWVSERREVAYIFTLE